MFMLALNRFDPELWYCFLVVKTPTAAAPIAVKPRKRKQQQQQKQDEQDSEEAAGNVQDEEGTGTNAGTSASRKRKRRPVAGTSATKIAEAGERRTSICYAKDPLAFVDRLNRSMATSSGAPPPYVYEIVTVMGPLASEADGKLIKVAWDYKSRGVVPRALWAQELACQFNLPICHNAPVMLGIQEHFEVLVRDTDVYLYPRNVIVV